jgi:hypothetical protein
VQVRQALDAEIPYLQQRLDEYGGGEVDRLDRARCFVAVEGDKVIGIFPIHMVWQGGPLYIFPECKNKITRSRATWMLFESACAWLSDKTKNKSGIRWFFGVVRSKAVKRWASRIGLYRQYVGAAIYTKYLGD